MDPQHIERMNYFQLWYRGWRYGAALRAIGDNKSEAFQEGYKAGREAGRAAADGKRSELGLPPATLLRSQDKQESEDAE